MHPKMSLVIPAPCLSSLMPPPSSHSLRIPPKGQAWELHSFVYEAETPSNPGEHSCLRQSLTHSRFSVDFATPSPQKKERTRKWGEWGGQGAGGKVRSQEGKSDVQPGSQCFAQVFEGLWADDAGGPDRRACAILGLHLHTGFRLAGLSQR